MEDSNVEVKSKRKRRESNENGAKKKKKALPDSLEEEKLRLEKLVLGDSSYLLRNLAEQSSDGESDSGVEDENEETGSEHQFSDTLASPSREPAWRDEDDEQPITVRDAVKMQGCRHMPLGGSLSGDYQVSLRKKFEVLVGQPEWAKLNRSKPVDPEEDEDDAVLRTCGNFISKKSSHLPKTILDVKRLPSLNSGTRNEGRILKAVEFHPRSTVALVAGLSGIASIFQVDGRGNNKLASVQFERFPIKCARFTKDGNQFIVGSNHHTHFYCYDMMEGRTIKIPTNHHTEITNMKKFEVSPDGKLIAVCGRFGSIHLLTANTKEWVSTLRMNGEVAAIAFNSDGSLMYSHGESGEVYVWDMSRRACSHRFFDEGCLAGTSLAVSPSDQLLACGSSSGVVNIYDATSVGTSKNPSPVKAVMNLVTSATHLAFDPTSQILALSSSEKDNAVKLLHFPSMTVFSNFPTLKSELFKVQGCSFSPSSGFMSVINNKSTAFLYRLRHFGNY